MPKKSHKISQKSKKGKADSPAKLRIRQRQEKVFELTIKGLTQDTIARMLKVDRRTVAEDLEIIRTQKAEWIDELKKQFNPKKFWSERLTELRLMKKEMYAALAESKGDRTMVIRALNEINEEMDKCLAKVGIKSATDDGDEANQTLRIIHINRQR